MPQTEITAAGPLLDADGRLALVGWARHPYRDANLERAAPGLLQRWRLKRWDYYGLWTDDLFASATLSHIGYAALAFVYTVGLRDGAVTGLSRLHLLGRGVELPRNSDAGDVAFDDGHLRLAFDLAPGQRRVSAVAPGFAGGRGLTIDVVLAAPPAHESIVMCTPMGGDRFYYNRKLNGLRASGIIRVGERTVAVTPTRHLGQLDWGRGVWPYRTHWLWASANGVLGDGRVLGLNLGAGFGDLSRGTENAAFVDGRLHKLGRVTFVLDGRDYTRPWRLRDDEGRLDVTLSVHAERIDRSNLGVLRSAVHQCFGHFRGRVVLDDGQRLDLDALPGFAEEHFARW